MIVCYCIQWYNLDVYKGLQIDESEYDSLFEDNVTGTPYYYKVKDSEPDLNEIKRKSSNGNTLPGMTPTSLIPQEAD